MKSTQNINFYLKQLSIEEIERYLILNDNNLFERLSARLDIHEYSKKLFKNAIHFTLYDTDNMVGFSPCYFDKNNEGKAYISALIISKSYQDIGLEERLLNSIKEYAKQNNFNQILVSFHCQNFPSIEFYESNSFKRYSKAQNICLYKFIQK